MCLVMVVSGCTIERNGNVQTKSTTNSITIPVVKRDDGRYVSLKKLAGVMGYQVSWDEGHQWMLMGGNDVHFQVSAHERKGIVGGQTRRLTKAAIVQGDDLLIPDTTVSEMFQEELKYFIKDKHMTLFSFPELTPDGADFDFKDAPSDGKVDDVPVLNPAPSPVASAESALTHVSIDKVISRAQTFIGVPYLFAAKSYDVTRRFDCSSFTQYVYAKEGLKLPRSSRDQALQGIAVSRQALKPGDLMFFYVPGRFSSNSIIGHVGLYIGNGQMIHATPSTPSGVKITSINSNYWKQKFLKARRVATPYL